MNKLLKLPVLDILDSGTHNHKFTVAGYFTLMLFACEHIPGNSTEIYVYLRVVCCSTIFPWLPVLMPSVLSVLTLYQAIQGGSALRQTDSPHGQMKARAFQCQTGSRNSKSWRNGRTAAALGSYSHGNITPAPCY